MFTLEKMFKLLSIGIVLFIVIFLKFQDSREVEMASKLVGLEFEVYGRVQGENFVSLLLSGIESWFVKALDKNLFTFAGVFFRKVSHCRH